MCIRDRHSPGFLLIWRIGHSQSSSMTTSHNSQTFPMVCHRVLCWAQFSSSCTQDLFLTWFSVTLLSLNLSRTILSSKSLSLHRTFNLQYLLWKPVCQTARLGCWKLVSWCPEPSQPQMITSGLKTNFNLSPSYSAQKLSNHKISKINKTSPDTNPYKTKHIHRNNFFEELLPSVLPLLKST